MAVRTDEQLQLFFQLNKEKRQKQKQLAREKKNKQYQKEYRQKQQQIKEALREEKKKKIEQLQYFFKKPIQEPPKQQQSFQLHIYHSSLIERDPDENELYQTREELMEAEKTDEGKLNWPAIDKLIQEFHKKYL